MSIQWYPGHMHKATREMKELLPTIDLVIEVLDARLPYSSENPVIGQLRTGKPCIKLLNKSDLADAELTEAWIRHFDQEAGVKAMAVTQEYPDRIRNLADLAKKLVPTPMDAMGNIHALIMGIPNVGKSTIINTLAGRTIAKTGNEPAITKQQQVVNLHNGIVLHDTPGILWPKIENEKSTLRLAATGAIKESAMSYDEVAYFTAEYLLHHYPELLKSRYKLQSLPASETLLLESIGRLRGCLGTGGVVKLDKVAKILLGELRAGTLGRLTMESPTMVMQEKIDVALKLEQKAAEKKAKLDARKKGSRGN